MTSNKTNQSIKHYKLHLICIYCRESDTFKRDKLILKTKTKSVSGTVINTGKL